MEVDKPSRYTNEVWGLDVLLFELAPSHNLTELKKESIENLLPIGLWLIPST